MSAGPEAPEGALAEAIGRTLVTLDGPAGVGKSTTAREVARRLGWRYLDSGALYRAVTWALLDAGAGPDAWPELTRADLDGLGLSVEPADASIAILHRGRRLLDELRTDEVTASVSAAARLETVRGWLLDAQRRAGVEGHLVADGRDMGTVVFPHAATKVFLTADPDERARRRLGDRGVGDPDSAQVAQERARLEARDRVDMEREVSPLVPAPDATHLDTTRLDFDAQVGAVVKLARAASRAAEGEDSPGAAGTSARG